MLILTKWIERKLIRKHHIADPVPMIKQAFNVCNGICLIDTREEHKTPQHTQWFIAKINKVFYKVVFIRKDGDVIIKTMYEPTKSVIQVYKEKMASVKDKKKFTAKKKLLNKIIRSKT